MMLRRIFATAAVVLACAQSALGIDDNGESEITELTTDNFDDLTKEGVWLIEFYGPTCGFCKMIEPEIEKLAKEVREDEIDMNVAKVNVREARELSTRFNIGSLPGIKLLRDGEVYTLPEARRARSQDEYIEYAMESFAEVEAAEEARIAEEIRVQAEIDARSNVVKLDLDNFEELVSEGNWLIDFYGPKCGYCKKLAPTWELLGDLVNTDDTMGFKVAKFDAAAGFKYTRQFKANPWPAIRYMKDGKIYHFPDSRNFDLTLQDYVDYAKSGYTEQEEEPLDPEFIEQAKKRADRKKKYGKWKKKKPAAHDEL
jgi:thiol-disulfide isomerase/thioredoxin